MRRTQLLLPFLVGSTQSNCHWNRLRQNNSRHPLGFIQLLTLLVSIERRTYWSITLSHWILGLGDPYPVHVKFRACPLTNTTSIDAVELFRLAIMGIRAPVNYNEIKLCCTFSTSLDLYVWLWKKRMPIAFRPACYSPNIQIFAGNWQRHWIVPKYFCNTNLPLPEQSIESYWFSYLVIVKWKCGNRITELWCKLIYPPNSRSVSLSPTSTRFSPASLALS